MKRLIPKLILCLVPAAVYLLLSWFIDPFNVFHAEKIRITRANSNDNFVKTEYILKHPDRFNAFVLGSSRVGNIPESVLPEKDSEERDLRWYNMTYAMGGLGENTETVKTFLRNGVEIRSLLIGFDEISMQYARGSEYELIYRPYQDYEENKAGFYLDYLENRPDPALLPEVLSNDSEKDEEIRRLYYSYGVYPENCDLSVPEGPSEMAGALPCGAYSGGGDVFDEVRDLAALCREYGIDLVLFTSPTLETTYENSVEQGYLSFLRDLAEVMDYYNFAGLNAFTADMRYYFDSSHYRPYVGKRIGDCLYGTKTEREAAVREAGGEETQFGIYVDGSNADEVIRELENQLLTEAHAEGSIQESR